MYFEHHKSKKPKRNSKISTSKRKMLATAKNWTANTTPKLRKAYSTKTEWAINIIPKLKEK